MDEAVFNKIRESVAPQNRLDLQRQVESEYAAAEKLLEEQKYKDALQKFKWVFANDAGHRLFLYGPEITKLIKNYPPAGAVIKRWRNDKERLVLEQKADSTVIRQWNTLNSCLKDKDRTINVFLKLQVNGADKQLLHAILNCTWERLALAKRYALLKDYLDSLGFHVFLHALEYDSLVLFPKHQKLSQRQRKESLQRHVEYLLQRGTLSYEVALGLGEKHIASEFAKKILSVETSDRFYAGLIKGAVRARAYPEAKAMFVDAKGKFSLRQLRFSLKAIRTMPKSEFARLSMDTHTGRNKR
jgi:hypothetical protein